MKSFKEIVENKELELAGKEISDLTDANDHMGALVVASKLVRDKRLAKAIEGMKAIRDYQGGADGLREVDIKLRKNLDYIGRKTYGKDWDTYIYGNM